MCLALCWFLPDTGALIDLLVRCCHVSVQFGLSVHLLVSCASGPFRPQDCLLAVCVGLDHPHHSMLLLLVSFTDVASHV